MKTAPLLTLTAMICLTATLITTEICITVEQLDRQRTEQILRHLGNATPNDDDANAGGLHL